MRAVLLLSILLVVNLIIWVSTFFAAAHYSLLLGLVALAYGFGLRHAVDADHIAAIDNTTRKLMQDGEKPISVGFFFSLGHATVVIVLSLLVAFSASYVKEHLPFFQQTGSLIGTIVSSTFLLFIGIVNLLTLIKITTIWNKVKKGSKYSDKALNEHLHNRGFFARLLKPILKTIHRSWHLYPVGILFGLGFDTATEIGLLSISAATGVSDMPIFYMLLIPFAFTAGMTLVDTLDGMLMLGAYGWAYIKPVRKLYYNMCITAISVFIALFIGGIEMLKLLSEKAPSTYQLLQPLSGLQLTNVGYITIIIFAASWGASMIIYKIKGYDLLDQTALPKQP